MSAESLLTDNIANWALAVQNRTATGRGSSKKIDLYGIKKLRELILELAVRGKLVPQNPEDEPASTLLEKIAAAKAQLIKDKIIRKPKKLPELSQTEKLFEIPDSWEWCHLADIGQVIGGGTPKSGEPSYWAEEGGINWLTPADLYGLKSKYISVGKRSITDLGLTKSSAQLMPKGTVLFSSRAPIGYVAIAQAELSTNQGFKSCVPYIEGLSGYIYQFLKRSAKYIDADASGTTFKEVSGSIVSAVPVPLPPLKELQRIDCKVDELMSLCDQLEQQTETSHAAHTTLVENLLGPLVQPSAAAEGSLTSSTDAAELEQNWHRVAEHFTTLFTTEESIDQLKQTVLQLAVMGKLIQFDKSSRHGLLKEFLSFGPRNGFSPKESPKKTAVKVLKQGATSRGELNLDESKYVDVDVNANSHLWLKSGDILIQRGNSANFVGSNCLITSDFDGFIYPDLMMKIRPVKGLNSEFLSIWLSAPESRSFMWERMTGTSGTMPKISKKIVEAIPIIVPTENEQNVLVNKVAQLMTLCDQLKTHLQQAQQTRLHLADAMVEQSLT